MPDLKVAEQRLKESSPKEAPHKGAFFDDETLPVFRRSVVTPSEAATSDRIIQN